MKHLIALWFFARVIVGGLLFSTVLLFGAFIYYCVNKTGGLGILKACDDLIASIFFFTLSRTLSGIAGEGKHKKKLGYKFIADIIDWLAVLFGDADEHCLRAYFWEKSKGFVL